MRIDEVLQRIQGEYLEMPGLRLTPAQAQRLWGLERSTQDFLCGPAMGPSCEWKGLVRRTSRAPRPATGWPWPELHPPVPAS